MKIDSPTGPALVSLPFGTQDTSIVVVVPFKDFCNRDRYILGSDAVVVGLLLKHHHLSFLLLINK